MVISRKGYGRKPADGELCFLITLLVSKIISFRNPGVLTNQDQNRKPIQTSRKILLVTILAIVLIISGAILVFVRKTPVKTTKSKNEQIYGISDKISPTNILSQPTIAVIDSSSGSNTTVTGKPTITPTSIDWKQFNKELNESSKDIRNNSDESSEPTTKPTETVISIEQQQATKINSISDNLGNTHETSCRWSDTHYECPPKEQKQIMVSIKTTPQLTFTINAQDPNNRPLTYHYYYEEGCRGDGTNWVTSNSCTSTLKTNELGLRTFIFYVKNDDNYGSVGLDANTSLYYKITE